jgi:four helix bundle protein
VSAVYGLTRQGPLAQNFGLSGQIQRAGVSIMSNIAEGFERTHIAEKLQFYNIARGSSAEVRSLLCVIEDNFSPEGADRDRSSQRDRAGRRVDHRFGSLERAT